MDRFEGAGLHQATHALAPTGGLRAPAGTGARVLEAVPLHGRTR